MDAPNEWKRRPELKDWVLEHELGRGSSGTVYVVRQRHTGDRAALKVSAAEADREGAYSHEVQALASMSHQHIVELIGSVSTDQGEGILMEYLPGGSVADLIAARGPLTLGETVTVIAPLAGALAFLHENGAVHGDIAPGNVLFTAEGKPKLADLGLAVLVGGHQAESGTPGFRAPSSDAEPSGGRRLRPARDVYSLAALAWYMVTGRVAGPTQQRPPLSSLLGGVPTDLVELLESGLSEDEDDRPGAEEFGRRIFRIAKPQPVNLRQSVRTEALGQMVTHVVADPATRRSGRGPAAWIRGVSPPRRSRKRRLRSGSSAPGRVEGVGRLGGADRLHRSSRDGRGPRQGLWWAVVSAAMVLLCLVVVGLVVAPLGRLGTDPAPAAHSAAATIAQSGIPGTGRDLPGEPTPAAGSTSQPSSAPSLTNVQEAAVFSDPVPDDPVKAARVLTARRDLALAGADATALRRVHAAGGNSLGPDLAISSQLRSRGLHYRGLETVLSDARVSQGSGDRVDVAVTSTMSAYQVVGADGATIQSSTEPEVQDIVLTLERVDDGWLIAVVADASGPTGNNG